MNTIGKDMQDRFESARDIAHYANDTLDVTIANTIYATKFSGNAGIEARRGAIAVALHSRQQYVSLRTLADLVMPPRSAFKIEDAIPAQEPDYSALRNAPLQP